MSTYLYLECLDHDPPLRSEDESGQHLSDLAQIKTDILNRERHVANAYDNIRPSESFRRNTASFLFRHQKCRIGVVDEYGVPQDLTEI